jgi:hypothetical protein
MAFSGVDARRACFKGERGRDYGVAATTCKSGRELDGLQRIGLAAIAQRVGQFTGCTIRVSRARTQQRETVMGTTDCCISPSSVCIDLHDDDTFIEQAMRRVRWGCGIHDRFPSQGCICRQVESIIRLPRYASSHGKPAHPARRTLNISRRLSSRTNVTRHL